MRTIAANLNLARRQQRITLVLLAERANLRILGLLQGVEDATDPLNTPIGRARAEQDVPKRVRR